MNKLNCLIFISGGGSNLKNIIEKINSGFLKDINIHKVITDNPSASGLKYAYEKKISTNIINEEYSYEDISMDISENDFNSSDLTEMFTARFSNGNVSKMKRRPDPARRRNPTREEICEVLRNILQEKYSIIYDFLWKLGNKELIADVANLCGPRYE